MWPFGSKKKKPVDLSDIHEEPARVALRVSSEMEFAEECGYIGVHTVSFVGDEGFCLNVRKRYAGDEEFAVEATNLAIERYRHHLKRMAALDEAIAEHDASEAKA